MKLTEKEISVLTTAIEVNTTVANADEGDFFSFFYPSEIVHRTSFSKEQVAGVLSSLSEKGLICEEGSKNTNISDTEWSVLWEAVEILRDIKGVS